MRPQFVFALLRHWGSFVTSGALIGALGIWQSTGHRVWPSIYWAIALAGFLYAAYRVWRDQQEEIAKLQEEIARLKVRPYDEGQRQLVRKMLSSLGADERDLLRYLVQFGEREQQMICTAAGLNAPEFGILMTRVDATGQLNREERQKPGRAGIDLFWRVNTEFLEVLKNEIFPRQEATPPRLFLR